MRRTIRRFPRVALPLLLAALLLAGCDDDWDDCYYDDCYGYPPPPPATTQILSSYYDDGNVVRYGDGFFEAFFPPPASDNDIWVGLYGADEWRGFLQFPLGGAGGVPAGARIDRGTLDLVVRSVQPGMRLLVDLVDVRQPLGGYGASNPEALWNEAMVLPLATVAADLPARASPGHVPVDVTALVAEAQARLLPSVQLRLRLDPAAAAGLTIFTDPWADTQVAPLLEVEYSF